MVIEVRHAVPGDARRMADVHVAAWRAAYRGVMPAGYLDGLDEREIEAVWRERLVSGRSERAPVGVESAALVAELDGFVVAIAAIGPDRSRPDDPSTGELWMLNADPAAWGTGAAVALHRQACQELAARRYREAVLWVVEQNARARRFYEREGWRDDEATKTELIGGADVTERRYRRRVAG